MAGTIRDSKSSPTYSTKPNSPKRLVAFEHPTEI